mmetsp:Transcript_13576/g.33373  ORF Transcript_13576/g.33373 Transcript_13576/m.33373 type:complete len:243 (+) Transcript_13576:2035-2763(+)
MRTSCSFLEDVKVVDMVVGPTSRGQRPGRSSSAPPPAFEQILRFPQVSWIHFAASRMVQPAPLSSRSFWSAVSFSGTVCSTNRPFRSSGRMSCSSQATFKMCVILVRLINSDAFSAFRRPPRYNQGRSREECDDQCSSKHSARIRFLHRGQRTKLVRPSPVPGMGSGVPPEWSDVLPSWSDEELSSPDEPEPAGSSSASKWFAVAFWFSPTASRADMPSTCCCLLRRQFSSAAKFTGSPARN